MGTPTPREDISHPLPHSCSHCRPPGVCPKTEGKKKIAAGRYKTVKKILPKQQKKKKKEGTKKWADYPVVGWGQEGKAVPERLLPGIKPVLPLLPSPLSQLKTSASRNLNK